LKALTFLGSWETSIGGLKKNNFIQLCSAYTLAKYNILCIDTYDSDSGSIVIEFLGKINPNLG
jgi:hypothetical protein